MSASASSSASCKLKTNQQNVENKDLIKVKLKKPKSWNWELSTSKSSSSIQFPEIQLYDHKDNFLASANDANLILGNMTPSHSSRRKHYPVNNDIRELLDELTTQMNRTGYKCLIKSQNIKDQSNGNECANKMFDYNTKIKSSVPMPKRSYVDGIDISAVNNFTQVTKRPQTELDDHIHINLPNKNIVAIKKSKSTTAVVNNTIFESKEGENNKKKYHRTYSKNSSMRFSSSILERLSVNKQCSSSSTDTQSNYNDKKQDLSLQDEDSIVYKPPKYELRSSHAGTLVVCKDSFIGQLRHRKNTTVNKNYDISLTQESPIDLKFINTDDITILKNNKDHSHNRQRGKMQRRKEECDKNVQNERNGILSSFSSSESDVNEIGRIRQLHTGEYKPILYNFKIFLSARIYIKILYISNTIMLSARGTPYHL